MLRDQSWIILYFLSYLITQLVLVCRENYISLQAFSEAGEQLTNPHDVGEGNVVTLRCLFPVRDDLHTSSTQIVIAVVKNGKTTIYQAECKEKNGAFVTYQSNLLKYSGVAPSKGYDKDCSRGRLQYKVQISSSLPRQFLCACKTDYWFLQTHYFQISPSSVDLTRSPLSAVEAGSSVTFMCASPYSNPPAILSFTFDEDLIDEDAEHSPSEGDIQNSLKSTTDRGGGATSLNWTTKVTTKMNGKLLICKVTHPTVPEGSLIAETTIDFVVEAAKKPKENNDANGGLSPAQSLLGAGKKFLKPVLIAVAVVLGAAAIAAMVATVYIVFRKREPEERESRSRQRRV